MAGLAVLNEPFHKIRWAMALATVSFLWTGLHQIGAVTEDVLQEAVNYVLTGRIDPQDGPEIVDQKSCVVLVPDLRNKRYIRYYLSRFRLDEARISKTYSGRQTFFVLEVENNDVVIEYLELDKTTVVIGHTTAQISLPGDINQTEKALKVIGEHCKAGKPKLPF